MILIICARCGQWAALRESHMCYDNTFWTNKGVRRTIMKEEENVE